MDDYTLAKIDLCSVSFDISQSNEISIFIILEEDKLEPNKWPKSIKNLLLQINNRYWKNVFII